MRELIEVWNSWWGGGDVPEARRGIARPRYVEPLLKEAESTFVSVITGPRRTGKTTIMHQVIQGLIRSGIDRQHILYAMLDSPALPQKDAINDILREFRKRNNLGRQERIYLFLDEAQYVPDWARWAKAIHDSENAKLYISGSTSAMLIQDSHASLVGRWRNTFVHPLTFGEFLEFRGVSTKVPPAEQYKYEQHLEDYARTGGFPEVVRCRDATEALRILTVYFDDFVLKDAARARAVRDLDVLRQVAVLMAHSVGTTLSVNKIARTLKVSAAAVSAYIDALCGVFLYRPCRFYSTSVAERTYIQKKYYMVDAGLRTAVTGKFDLGATVENLVYNHLIMPPSNVRARPRPVEDEGVYYWKSVHELDFYAPNRKLALEVKYKPEDEIKKGELKGLLSFAEKMKLKTVHVATASHEGEETIQGIKVKYTSTWELLLNT